MDVNDLLKEAADKQASDLHLKAGAPPFLRIHGDLVPVGTETLTAADTERIALEIMDQRMAGRFIETNEADFAYSLDGVGRFRVNVFRQRGSVGIVMRRVLPSSQTFDKLNLPPVVARLAEEPRGLLLVTGPTGSGKTTTCAAVIDHINSTRRCHIVTVEDPIEIMHSDKLALVNQREIGVDTEDFASALKRVARQDPDVIFIGEMRDPETVSAALRAAETGHFVLSTLHTVDATETINRIIDFFPSDQQKQVRLSLAGTLRGIVAQRLLQRAEGAGRIPAVEVLVMTGRAFDFIVNPEQTHLLEEVIAEGEYYGMQTFDQALLVLYRNGAVTFEEALGVSSNPQDFRLSCRQAGLPT
ncbi:MAG: type IV pilus twitching motility protein PilT [Actinomycetota bacterium]